jgi:hypothetical protein
MKTITLPEDLNQIHSMFEQAKNEDVIIQLADGRQFILSAIDDFEIELTRTRQNQELMTLLDQRAKQTQTISLEEVKRQLELS